MLIGNADNLGFTFVELLIALVLSAFVLLILTTLFLANVQNYQTSLNTNKLNQQLQTAVDIMTTEIRRAGYWSNASSNLGIDANNNPFMVAGSTDITVNASNNCILFTYDKNGTGSLPVLGSGSDDDRYGFQLSGGAIQERPNGGTFSCGATNWENITDPNVVTVTALSFTLNTSTYTIGPATRGLTMRSVDISVTGQLTNNATVTRTIAQHVELRNDLFVP
jgi:type II secretory pathway component PulJ